MNNKIKKIVTNTGVSLILVFSFISTVYAQWYQYQTGQEGAQPIGGESPYKGDLANFKELLANRILPFVFGAAGTIFVIMFIVGGIQYLTSAGNEESSTKAKKLLIDAVIGIVIVVAAWALADWILRGIGGQANFGI